MTFYDREEELETLTAARESPSSDFIVVYGRRRVGKTELLKEFCATQPHVYFLAAQEAEHRQREKFLDQVADAFDERHATNRRVGRGVRVPRREAPPRRSGRRDRRVPVSG